MPLSAGGLPLATSESQQRIHVRPEHVLSVSSSSSVGGGDVSVEHHPIRRHPSPPKKYPHHPHLHSTSGTSSGSSYHHHHHHAQHNAHTMMTQQPSIEDFGYTSPRLLLHQQSQAGSAVTSTMSKTNFKSSKTSGQSGSGFAGGRMVSVRPVTPPIIPAPISTVQDPKHTKFLKWQAREAVRKHYAKHAESGSSPQTAPPPHQPQSEATSVSFTSIDPRDTGGIVAVVVAPPPAESSPSLPIASLPSQRTASPASSSSSRDNNDGGLRDPAHLQRRLVRRRTSDEKELEKEKEKRRRTALDKIPFVPHVKTEYLERTFYTDIRNTVALSTMKLQRCRSAGMSSAGGGPAPPQPSDRSDDDHHWQHEPPIRDELTSIHGANEASAATPRLQAATARAKPPALPRPMSTRGTAHYEQPPAVALNATVTSLLSHVPSMTAIPQPLQTYTTSFEYQSTFLDRFNSRPSSAQHQPQPSAHHTSQSNTMSVVTSTATTPRPQSSHSPAPGDLLTDERLLGVNTSPTEDPRAEPNRPARPPQHFFITQNPPVINPQQPSSLPAIVTVNHTANNAAAQSLAALQDDALDPWVTALAPFEARDALLLAFRPGCTVERSKYAPPASRALRLEQLFKTLSCADEAFLDRVHYRSQDTDSRRKKVHASLRSVTGDIQERGDDGPFQHQLFKRLMAQDAREFYVNGAVEVERWYADREHLSDLKSAALERKLDMTKVVNTTTTHDRYGEKEIFGPNNNVQHFAHRAPPPQPSQPPAASATTRGMSARPASAAKQATVENLLLDVRRDIGKQLQKSHKEERSSLQRIFIHAFCKKISVDCFGGPGRLTTAASTILDILKKDVFLRQKPISAQSVLEWVQSIPADALFLHDVISICISLCSGLMMPISMWLVPLREKLQFAVATKAMVPLPDSADDVGWLLAVKPNEWGPRCIQWVCSLGFEKLMMERVARGNGKGRHELLDDELEGGGGGETSSSPLHNNRSLRDAIIQHLTAVPRQSFLNAMMPIVESMAARTSPPPSNIRNAAGTRKPNHQTFPLQRRGSMVMTSVPPTIRRAPSVASSVTSLRATVAPLPTAAVVVTAVVGPQRPPQLQPPVMHQRSPGSTHHPTPPETPMMLPLVLSDPLLLTSTNLRQQQQQSAAAAQSNDPMMMSTISDQQLLSSSTSISLSPPQGAPQQQHLSGQQQGRQPHSRHNSVSNPLSAGTAWSPDSAVTPPPATAATTAVQTQRRLSRRQYAGLKLPKYAVELLQKYNAAPGGPSVVAQTASSARLERHMSDAS